MDRNDEKPTPETPQRRPYTAPRIEESGCFEHLVLTCAFGATRPSPPSCTSGGVRSTH
jgi:hypothetical protein